MFDIELCHIRASSNMMFSAKTHAKNLPNGNYPTVSPSDLSHRRIYHFILYTKREIVVNMARLHESNEACENPFPVVNNNENQRATVQKNTAADEAEKIETLNHYKKLNERLACELKEADLELEKAETNIAKRAIDLEKERVARQALLQQVAEDEAKLTATKSVLCEMVISNMTNWTNALRTVKDSESRLNCNFGASSDNSGGLATVLAVQGMVNEQSNAAVALRAPIADSAPIDGVKKAADMITPCIQFISIDGCRMNRINAESKIDLVGGEKTASEHSDRKKKKKKEKRDPVTIEKNCRKPKQTWLPNKRIVLLYSRLLLSFLCNFWSFNYFCFNQ